jgi:hypothetical protein
VKAVSHLGEPGGHGLPIPDQQFDATEVASSAKRRSAEAMRKIRPPSVWTK